MQLAGQSPDLFDREWLHRCEHAPLAVKRKWVQIVNASPVRTFVMGGLGNQLFQLATLSSLARSRNVTGELIVDWFQDFQQREFWLASIFNLDTIGVRVRVPKTRRLGSPFVRAKWQLRLKVPQTRKFIERPPGFDARIMCAEHARLFVGYFQSYEYFQKDYEWFLANLRLGLANFCLQRGAVRNESASNSVALHLRLGDYLSRENRNKYGAPPTKYVQRALAQIRASEGRMPNVVVFTDDADEAALIIDQFLTKFGDFTVAGRAPAPVDLYRMADFGTLIMANSTLSWWAGALCEDAGGQVFFPRPWVASPRYDGEDLVRPAWVPVFR